MSAARVHRHRPRSTEIRPFFHPVAATVAVQDRRAHGGIVLRSRCRCGAVRDVVANQGHRERGPWLRPEAEPSSLSGGPTSTGALDTGGGPA